MTYETRRAQPRDGAAIAAIWRDGWLDGHLEHVDQRLIDARSPAAFLERTDRRLAREPAATTVAVTLGGARIAGFVMRAGDEVEQLYVAADQRGSSCAALLLRAAEQQIAAAGLPTAWLAVVAGNARARRFYSKHGWTDAGAFTYAASGAFDGEPAIEVHAHRYEKRVAAD